MIKNKHILWEENEYSYSGAINFIPNIQSFIHKDNQKRKAIIVIPGGGYGYVSPSEASNVATEFYNKGYNTFVLTYTINLLNIPLNNQPLKDLSRAISYIRYHSEMFNIFKDKISVIGFSAGGHLAGSIGVFHQETFLKNSLYQNTSNMPNALCLCYPVINSSKYAHAGSFINLLGSNASKEELEYYSLEKQVNRNMPPTFIWHTTKDDAVPYINSLLMAKSLFDNNIKHELVLFNRGGHGLSLANKEWATGIHESFDCEEQIIKLLEHYLENNLVLPDNLKHYEKAKDYLDVLSYHKYLNQNFPYTNVPYDEIKEWPVLFDNWLKEIEE